MIKKITSVKSLFLLGAIAFNTSMFAQNHFDLLNAASRELTGTARTVGMGGAFGALGGDAGGVYINPAGIGLYRGTEFSTTLSMYNLDNKTSVQNGYDISLKKFNVSIPSISYITSIALNSDQVPFLNIGFAYNREKPFRQKYQLDGGSQPTSLSDYIANKSNGYSRSSMSTYGDVPWVNYAAYGLGVISYDANQSASYNSPVYVSGFDAGVSTAPFLNVNDRGAVSRYDFTLGTTVAEKLSLGLTLSITSLDYTTYSYYTEGSLVGGVNNGFDLENALDVDGAGFQASIGVIYRPVDALRLGVSYQTPTWYDVTDSYSARMSANMPNGQAGAERLPYSEYDYKMRTPDKWTLSAAAVIGKRAILSADYEITNYKNMSLSTKDGDSNSGFTESNKYLKEDFRAASMIRLGGEYRFTPRFTGRIGYALQQSPITDKMQDGLVEVVPGGTMFHYILPKDTHYLTYGLGYKFTRSIYGDIAFVFQNKKADLYAFSPIFNDQGDVVVSPLVAELKSNKITSLLTVGVRF